MTDYNNFIIKIILQFYVLQSTYNLSIRIFIIEICTFLIYQNIFYTVLNKTLAATDRNC